MKNMKCWNCVLKHLASSIAWCKPEKTIIEHIATALSYAREIKSGHNKGFELDHRPDFLGELVITEHLLLENNIQTSIIIDYRRMIQERQCDPKVEHVVALRSIFEKVKTMLQNKNVEVIKTNGVDLIGELNNACDHLILLDVNIYKAVESLKRKLEYINMMPEDIEQIRRLWFAVESKSLMKNSDILLNNNIKATSGGCGCGKSKV